MLVMASESEPKNITAARQVVRKATFETPVSVSMQASGLIAVNPHPDVPKNHARMTAEGNTDDDPGSFFHITKDNFAMVNILLSKYQKVGEDANVPTEKVYIKEELFSYPSGVHASKHQSSDHAVHYKLTQAGLEQMAEHKIVKNRDEGSSKGLARGRSVAYQAQCPLTAHLENV